MSQILSGEEIEALMVGLEEGSIDLDSIEEDLPSVSTSEEKKVSSFFFGQKTAIRVGALPGLDLINEHLSSQLSFKLSQKVGKEVHVQPKSTINQIFGRFLHDLNPPLFLNIMRVEPSQSMALLGVDGEIMYHVLEGFFGGTGDSERPFRNFSPFEMKVIDRILDVCREQIELSWRKLDPSFRFILTRSENQPQFAAVMPLDETVFLINFAIEVGDVEGTITICFPQVILGLFKQQLKVGFQRERLEVDTYWMDSLVHDLGSVPVRVDPMVASFTMRVREMLSLKIGDVLMLKHVDLSEEMPIMVAGLHKFNGQAGVVKGKRAVRITEVVREPVAPIELPSPSDKKREEDKQRGKEYGGRRR